MTIRLPAHPKAFPKAEAPLPPANAWGDQWKHLLRNTGTLVSNSHDGIRRVRDA